MKYIRQIIRDLKKTPLIIAISVGAVLRIQVILKSNFPINDGGLFFTMIKDLIANGYKLPFFTTYNSSQIPFAYPPFPFYFTAFLHQISKVQITDLLRFIPLINSILAIPIFYLLTRNLYSKKAAAFATLVFSILPRSFEWQIMGGGLTRSFGFLFSIITLYFLTKKSKYSIWFGSIFLALTCLSHLEWLAFTTISLILLVIFRKMNFTKLFRSCLMASVLVTPWLTLVILRFGIQPFVSFFLAGAALETPFYIQVLLMKITDEYYLTIFGVFAVIGVFIQISRKDWFTSLWLIVPLILIQRSAPNLTSIPISILSGIAIMEIYLFIKKLNEDETHMISEAFAAVIFFYSILNTVSLMFIKHDYYYYESITDSQRSDITSIAEKIPAQECVLVLTNKQGPAWGVDSIAEWFPALTKIKSPITAQGSEWLPHKEINKKLSFYGEIKSCFNTGLECLEGAQNKHKSGCKYIYVEMPASELFSTALIKKELGESKDYQLIFAGETASAYEKR